MSNKSIELFCLVRIKNLDKIHKGIKIDKSFSRDTLKFKRNLSLQQRSNRNIISETFLFFSVINIYRLFHEAVHTQVLHTPFKMFSVDHK